MCLKLEPNPLKLMTIIENSHFFAGKYCFTDKTGCQFDNNKYISGSSEHLIST